VLADAARDVAQGAGSCVQVVGEAGIGKTSLLAVAASELALRGVETRTVAADETDHRRTLGLVQALLPGTPADAIDAVERLAAAGPLALLADDVHWADEVSLDALAAIARRAEALGVLLVAAARPQPASPALRRLDATVDRCGVRLTPAPLDAADIADLVASRIGAPPGPALMALVAGAAGNPFLAVELVVGLADEALLTVRDGMAELADAGDGMPGDLIERLARRALLAVPGGELVLRATAAVPGGLTVDELAALLDQPLGDLIAVTLAAVEAAVLVDTGATLGFRHDLLRRAVLTSTPRTIVRSLQHRAASLLIDRGAAAERIAACLLASDESPDPAEVDHLLAVGRSMQARNPAAAADVLRRALDGLDPDDARSLPLTIEVGWALTASARARDVGPLLHDRVGGATGPLPVELLRLESVALSLAGRLGEAWARYEGIGPIELTTRFSGDDAGIAEAAAELAFLRLTSGRLDEAAQLVDWADRSPAPASAVRRAVVSTVRGWLAGARGAFEEGAEHARAALQAAAHDDRLGLTATSPTLALGLALDSLADPDGAIEVLRPRPGLGLARSSPLLQFGTALVLFRRGEWDDALVEADAGLLAAEETGLGLGAFWPRSIGALVSCARGQLAEARRWLDSSDLAGAPRELGMEWLFYASAAVHEAEGNIAGAATILDGIAGAVLDAQAPALLLTGAADMVRLALATGRAGAARRVADALEVMTGCTASPIVAATTGWVAGLVADEAGAIEAAADRLAVHGRAPEAARARHDAAVLAARAGDSDGARRLAVEAFRTYDRLGAEQWHRRLRSELREQDVVMRPRRTPARPSHGWASLTASESTIVDLTSQGLTNTQIAERLYVSRRTVESHLGRVYAKLGISTRAGLVATAARRPRLKSDGSV